MSSGQTWRSEIGPTAGQVVERARLAVTGSGTVVPVRKPDRRASLPGKRGEICRKVAPGLRSSGSRCRC